MCVREKVIRKSNRASIYINLCPTVSLFYFSIPARLDPTSHGALSLRSCSQASMRQGMPQGCTRRSKSTQRLPTLLSIEMYAGTSTHMHIYIHLPTGKRTARDSYSKHERHHLVPHPRVSTTKKKEIQRSARPLLSIRTSWPKQPPLPLRTRRATRPSPVRIQTTGQDSLLPTTLQCCAAQVQ